MAISPTFTLAQAQSMIRVLDDDLARRREAIEPIVTPHDGGPEGELKDLEAARSLLDEAVRSHPVA